MPAHELARLRRGLVVRSATVLAALAVLVPLISAGTASAAPVPHPSTSDPFPTGQVTIDGHGWGPGVGMGQWGAFGYAAVEHKTYSWILSHFYGGTKLVDGTDPQISVSMLENEGTTSNEPVIVTSESRFRFGGVKMPADTFARAVLNSKTGLWAISESSSCAGKGGWKAVSTAGAVKDPRAVPYSQKPTATDATLLTICFPGGSEETVRGLVEAYDYDNANTANKALSRTLNILPLDEYVADVVPSESSSGWGEVGGAGPDGEQWGFQELEAQAVAARTYTLAYMHDGGWYGYADICDTDDCQSYTGTTDESAIATAAVTDTAGEYLTLDGAPAPAQYSASTGGYTVASSFPAVVDEGDSVCLTGTGLWTCNEEHTWSASVPVATVEATFPSIGTLEAVTATSRDGLGQWGGRVLTIKIVGSKATVSETGDTFQSQFGLDSNWFLITHPKATTTSSGSSMTASGATGGVMRGTGPLP